MPLILPGQTNQNSWINKRAKTTESFSLPGFWSPGGKCNPVSLMTLHSDSQRVLDSKRLSTEKMVSWVLQTEFWAALSPKGKLCHRGGSQPITQWPLQFPSSKEGKKTPGFCGNYRILYLCLPPACIFAWVTFALVWVWRNVLKSPWDEGVGHAVVLSVRGRPLGDLTEGS